MKQTTLEPGLLQFLRLYIMVSVVLLPVLWRLSTPMWGTLAPLGQFVWPSLPVLVFLAIYTTLPWWQQRMGRLFLPVALILFAAQAFLGNYLTLQWLVLPDRQGLSVLAFMLRLWVVFQILELFVAWQYDLFWAFVSGITLCLLDAVLAFPFVAAGGMLYPLYVTLVVVRLVSVTAMGLALAWLMRRQREQRAVLAEVNQKLAQYAATNEQLAVSQERIRLARELHDTLAHSLSGVTVQLEAAESIWNVDQEKVHTLMVGALGNTRTGLTEARRALQALRAGALEEVGLRVAVGDLARSAAARGNLMLDLKLPDELPTLMQAEEQCVYRVAQEALSNVTRHARATQLRVELQYVPGQLTLMIADNGKGFDPALVNGGHFGLKGLRERADLVGAKVEVLSEPHQGTTLTLRAPVTEVQL